MSTETHTLSLHDALPIWAVDAVLDIVGAIEGFEQLDVEAVYAWPVDRTHDRSEEHTSELQSHSDLVCRLLLEKKNLKRRRCMTVPRLTLISLIKIMLVMVSVSVISIPCPPRPTLFPYTTLFRSGRWTPCSTSWVRSRGSSSSTSKPCTPGPSIAPTIDRKSTRLNSSHTVISYAVFCLKKKI